MARSDREVVLANAKAFNAMDVEAMLALYAADAEVVDRRRPGVGSFRGHGELRPYYLSIFHSAAELDERLEIVGADGAGRVAAHCELVGRLAADPRGTGVTVVYGLAYVIADGRIARLEIAEDGAHALELSGLAGAES